MASPTRERMEFHPDWLIPDWPAPANVRAVCTTRAGGVSEGAYASLNLGDHVGDAIEAVHENRRRFASSLTAHPVFLKQVHGTEAAAIDEDTPDGTEADACVTAAPNVACTIMVADCLPVLFATRDGAMVGAAHAGWRGLAGGVLEAAALRVMNDGGAGPRDVIVWLGPCIGPTAFEVGDEVRAAFATDEASAACFTPGVAGKWFANLAALARLRLRALHIDEIHGNDGTDPWCTVLNPSRFFSHRRDRVSGRFAAAVWRC